MSDTDAMTEISLRNPHHRIEKRAVAWWMMRSALLWGVMVAALLFAFVTWEPARAWLVAPLAVVSVILVAKVAIEPLWRYRVHRWEVTEHATYAVTGWLVREWRVAPTSRIQTVDAVRGPIEQLLGLSTLRVTTASANGAVKVSGLDRKIAEETVTRLAMVAEVTEGDAT